MKQLFAILFLAVPLMAQFGGARKVTPQGATLPARCSTGDLYQKTGASAGLYNCIATDTWRLGGGGTVANAYTMTFTGQTTLTATAATHGQGTAPGVLFCRPSSGSDTVGWVSTVNGSGDITVVPTAGGAYTGTCKIVSGNGIVGPTGATGAAGAAATVAVGTVTTGAAGSSASVTNSGSSSAATFDFTIPRGDTGPQGAQGVPGPAGPPGGANYSQSFTTQTAATLTHNLNSTAVIVACYDGSNVQVIPASVTLTDANNIAVMFSPALTGKCVVNYSSSTGGGGSMTYPGAGVGVSTGSAWGTSLAVGTSANNLVQLNGSAQLPAVSAALLTNFPTLNQSTTGNAATATALETARTIMGLSFNGTANIGSRSGNTTEFATVSGTKTASKQLAFDANGNITASAYDVGAAGGGTGVANASVAFAGDTTKTLTGATHGFGTENLIPTCYDNSSPRERVEGYKFTVDGTSYDAVFTFPVAFTGLCVVNGSGGSSGGAGTVTTGTGLLGNGSSGNTVRIDPATVPTFLTGTGSLTMSTFGSSNCEEGTITVTGAATGDPVMLGVPSTIGAGLIAQGRVTSTDTVTVRVCRMTGSSTISAQTFRATILRSF